MGDAPRTIIFVGIKNAVIALYAQTGEEVWRTKLKSGDFVTVLWDGSSLIAANAGELYALNPTTGAILWHNPMKGLGLGLVTLASARTPALMSDALVASAHHDQRQKAGAAASAAT